MDEGGEGGMVVMMEVGNEGARAEERGLVVVLVAVW